MSQESNSKGPKFVEPTSKGKYRTVILVLIIVCISFAYLYFQEGSENSDLKKQIKQVQTSTTTTPSTTRITTTTTPSSQIAKIDVIAKNNDSDRTTARIKQDFADRVVVTQVPSEMGIEETAIVVNNPAFEDLANELVNALSAGIGLVPEGLQASVADIVIYVKS